MGLLRSMGGAVLCPTCQESRRAALVAFENAVGSALADRVLTPAEEQELRRFQSELGLLDADVAQLVPSLWRGKFMHSVITGQFPPVQSCPLLPKRGETPLWVEPARLFEERTKQVYVGRSQGVTFRIVKGVSYRVGASGGQRVPVSEIVAVGDGSLVLTNKRLVFVGPRQVSVALAKLISVSPYVDGIELHYEGQKRRQFVAVNDGEITTAAILVTAEREA